MVWVHKIEIPVDLVVETKVKKIPKVKSLTWRLQLQRNLESSCMTILVFVKNAKLGMCLVAMMTKMISTSVLILEKGIKTDQLERREERRVYRYIIYPHVMNDIW